MRSSLILLLCALAGILGGGALIGVPALGGCLIFDSLAVGVWALLREDGEPAASVHQIPVGGRSLGEIFDQARAS